VKPTPAQERVITLLNAICELRDGDLNSALALDDYTPWEELGPADTFKGGGEDAVIVRVPGPILASKSSRRYEAETGEELEQILKSRLQEILNFASVAGLLFAQNDLLLDQESSEFALQLSVRKMLREKPGQRFPALPPGRVVSLAHLRSAMQQHKGGAAAKVKLDEAG
jgi:hypothetical protein